MDTASHKTDVRRQREVVDLLLTEGIITREMLEKGKQEVRRTGLRIEKALEKLGFIKEEDIVKVRANALNLPYVDLSDYTVDAELTKLVPEHIAKKYKAVPLFKINNSITIGMVDPQDVVALDHLRRLTGVEQVEPVLVSEQGVQRVLDFYYRVTGSIQEIVTSLTSDPALRAEAPGQLADASIIRLVDMLIIQAVKDRGSDLHIEPEEDTIRVRCRIDGILHELTTLPKKLHNAVISRVKILASLDIAESRKPQDGRFQMKIENKELDIRVSTFPTIHGENLVLRLLDKASVLFGLKELGLQDREFQAFAKLIRHPNGIILVTGPTGSGKTTTLYSALSTISSIEKNIITIEDPVEYELHLIRQTQVNSRAGITFANGLRSILRQDPNIIMVGEIRDKETADVAIQAALTGHLVLSTLHTNDAASSLARLIEMGVEPFLVSSSVIGILAQRLIRMVCDKCKERYHPEPEVLKDLGLPANTELYKGRGCLQCKKSGYKGRTGIFEVLVISDEIKHLIDRKAPADQIFAEARRLGMKILRDDGIRKLQQGLTTAEEVLRVTETE